MYSLILHGRRSIELQKWRNLRFAVKLLENASSFSNSFSSATAAAYADASLRVDSPGLAKKLADSISRKVSFENKGNPDYVLNLLRSYGFTDSQISNIIRTDPRLLTADAEKSLGPKLQFLQSRGASSSELTEIVSKVPKILGMKGDKTISVYYDFVKVIIEADKSSKFEELCHSLPEGSNFENKTRNISVLRGLGVPQRLLFSLLTSNSSPVCGKERFEESLRKVVEMGFDPTTSNFVLALCMLYQMSEKTIEEKVEVYRTVGFTVDDIWEIFKKAPSVLKVSKKKIANSIETFIGLGLTRDEFAVMVKRFPPCLNFSAELVKKKTDFLVKKMNWSLKAVVSQPSILGCSMEKRIVPRCNVIKALMSKGLLRDRGSKLPPMRSVLLCTDQDFLNLFVRKHVDKELVAELMAIFTGDRVS